MKKTFDLTPKYGIGQIFVRTDGPYVVESLTIITTIRTNTYGQRIRYTLRSMDKGHVITLNERELDR